ncbi:MAG: substrate-binding domain-containing protein [Pseudomonadota bacterium]
MNLKELSENLGLSQTTVSRALNGYPEVSESTRNRVMTAAKTHGYRPNTRAKGLATGRSLAIGHILPMSAKHEMVNPIFGDFIAGAGEVYSRHGYDMVLTIVEDGREGKAYEDLKAKGTIDGFMVHAPKRDEDRIPLLKSLGLPFVVHGRASDAEKPYWWVDVNNAHAFGRATELLCDLNHRRIALINGLETMDFAQRRREGYRNALRKRGLPEDPALMASDEMTESWGYTETLRMRALEDPPTAFLVSSIISAIGVRRALEDLGLKIGRDVSVITHDDALSYFPNGTSPPMFTATQSSVREAGRVCAELLIEQIQNPALTPKSKLLEAQLILGASTGPAPSD